MIQSIWNTMAVNLHVLNIVIGYTHIPTYLKLKSTYKDRFKPRVHWSTCITCEYHSFKHMG
jgi:hypothetical protein